MLQDQSRNRTPMPGAQAPAATPPDTGPARAEAGIAAMLAAEAPAELPAPGSPEAMAAFSAACRAVDRASFIDESEAKALKIGSGLQYWTSDVVEAARMGNFSRIMPQDVEAAKATSRERLRELLVLALRRELRMAEAEQASRLCELHSLAYPDDQEEVTDTTPAGDAVDLAIEAHRAARAALTAACNPADEVFDEQNGGDISDESIAPARAIHEAASDAETDAWESLLETRPNDPDGLLRMLRYIGGAGPMEVLGDAREFGRNIAEAAEAALRPPAASPALTAMVKEWHILTGAINAKGNTDEEVERIGARLDAVQSAIYEFPAASMADLLAKVPVFRDELYDATNGLSEGYEPQETLAGAAWLGLFRDFARLAGGAATVGGEEQAPDPVHALIAEHRAAYAEWDRLSKVWGDCVFGSAEERAADEARKPSGDLEATLLKALVAACPTTLAGIAALAEYLPGALRQVDPDDHEPDSEVALRNIAAALRALGSASLPDAGLAAALEDRRAKAGEFTDLMRIDGFVPFPADKPTGLLNIKLAIPAEAERLLTIAQTEFDRRADAYASFPPAERDAHLARMRGEYRLGELAAAVRGRPVQGQSEPSHFDQIIGCWREWIAASGPDETDAERETWDCITARRDALLDTAEELPPTLENLPAKALALAWLEYVGLWENGLARDGYAISGRLALDIDAAIGGRFRTGA